MGFSQNLGSKNTKSSIRWHTNVSIREKSDIKYKGAWIVHAIILLKIRSILPHPQCNAWNLEKLFDIIMFYVIYLIYVRYLCMYV